MPLNYAQCPENKNGWITNGVFKESDIFICAGEQTNMKSKLGSFSEQTKNE